MPAAVPTASAPSATQWLSNYFAEFGHHPGNAQQLCAFASNRGGRLPYSAAREVVASEASALQPEVQEVARAPVQAWTPYPRQEALHQSRQTPQGPPMVDGSPLVAAASRYLLSPPQVSIADALWNRLAVMESSASLSTSLALSAAELREGSEGALANSLPDVAAVTGIRPLEVQHLSEGGVSQNIAPGDFGGGEELWEDYSVSSRVQNGSGTMVMEESDHQLAMALEAEQWDRLQGNYFERNEESERWSFEQEATEEQAFLDIISTGLEVPRSFRRNWDLRPRRRAVVENSEEAILEAESPSSNAIGEEVRRLLRQDPRRRVELANLLDEQRHALRRNGRDHSGNSDRDQMRSSQSSSPSERRSQLPNYRSPHWSGLRRIVDRDILARTHASGILAELAHDAVVREVVARAADEVAVQSFLGTLPETRSEAGVECAICLDDAPTGSWKGLPCSHSYHEVCLRQWLNTSTARRSCPLCRLDLNLEGRSDEQRLGASYPELAALRLAEASLEFEIAVQESELLEFLPPSRFREAEFLPPSHFIEVAASSAPRRSRRHPTAIRGGGADGRAEWQVYRRPNPLLRFP